MKNQTCRQCRGTKKGKLARQAPTMDKTVDHLLNAEVPLFFVTFLSKITFRMQRNSTNVDTFADLSDSCKVGDFQLSNQNGDRKSIKCGKGRLVSSFL